MNAIIGMAYLALKSDLTPQQQNYLSKIHEAGSDLLKVINDILELSKLDAGKLGTENITFSLRDIFAEHQRRFSKTARTKGLSLRFNIAPNVPRNLVGDPLRFGQILGHLLENAVRLTESGTVKVSCTLEESQQRDVVLNITVSDTGPGMKPGQVAALQRLFAGDAPPVPERSTQRSSGLGLLLSHKLAVVMGGSLSVDSVLDKGSSFTLRVTFSVRRGSRLSGSRVLGDIKILAVDDDPISLTTLKELLENFGMQVQCEQSPEAALDIIVEADQERTPFDLIILDWRMPEIDGVEMTKRIRTNLHLQHAPVLIMLSAYSWQGITLQAEAAGVDAYLHKPINESVLLDTIMNLMRPHEAALPETPVDSGSVPADTDSSGKNAEDVLDESAAGDVGSLQGLQVLIVEDNLVNQEVAKEIISSAGLVVTLANNGKEAVELFDEQAPAPPFFAVLMDLQMPVMGGFEACRKLRQLAAPWACDLPVIAMTAHSKETEAELCSEAGMNDHVSKPIDIEQLFSTLQRWRPVTPVSGDAEAALFRQVYDAILRKNDSALPLLDSHAEMFLSRLHGGRLSILQTLLENDDHEGAADFLERHNATLHWKA